MPKDSWAPEYHPTESKQNKYVEKIEIIRYRAYRITLKLLNAYQRKWWCAYVTLSHVNEVSDRDELSYETYRDGNTVGIDTAHSFNELQSLDKKKQDAIFQIQALIDDYENRLRR